MKRLVWLTVMTIFMMGGCATQAAPPIAPPEKSGVASAIVDNPVDSITIAQKQQLAALDMPVILPKYLPPGFQVTRFKAHQAKPKTPGDYSYYTVSYRGPNNTCLEVGNGYQNSNLSTEGSRRKVDTSVGTYQIRSGKYRQTAIAMQWADLPIGQLADAVSIHTGGWLSYERESCQPIAPTEFDKVLQSSTFMPQNPQTKPITFDRGDLLTPDQVQKLRQLPITIVTPTAIPIDFKVVKVNAGSGKYANGDDDAGYEIEYERSDKTCFAIRTSQDGARGLQSIGTVQSRLGAIKIYQDGDRLISFLPVAKGNPILISPLSRLNPKTGNYESCQPLDRTTYEAILQSIEIME